MAQPEARAAVIKARGNGHRDGGLIGLLKGAHGAFMVRGRFANGGRGGMIPGARCCTSGASVCFLGMRAGGRTLEKAHMNTDDRFNTRLLQMFFGMFAVTLAGLGSNGALSAGQYWPPSHSKKK